VVQPEVTKTRAGALVEVVRPLLLDALADDRVVRIEVVAMFPHADDFTIWLGTRTDQDRDALGLENPRLGRVQEVLKGAGFCPDQLAGLRTTAQSQETVDRDYQARLAHAAAP